jgi:DNA-binding NarL/FixJ family response regulator
MIKILIVDDNRLSRVRVLAFLAAYPEVMVVGEAEDGQAVLKKAKELNPDIVLMDVKMGGMNGLDATRKLKMELPDIQVIILSRYDLEAYRNAAEALGASAYVTKRTLVDELLPAIRRVAKTNQTAQALDGIRREKTRR